MKKLTHHQIILWLCNFHLCINKVVVGDFLQFTAELWDPPDNNDDPNQNKEADKMGTVDMPVEE
eukprot:7599379-Ditylum_brightwellii.AAC.1